MKVQSRPGMHHYLLVGLLTIGAQTARADQERDIPVSKLPPAVATTATQALAGGQLTEAEEIFRKGKMIHYEVEGVRKGQSYEMAINPEGQLLRFGKDD